MLSREKASSTSAGRLLSVALVNNTISQDVYDISSGPPYGRLLSAGLLPSPANYLSHRVRPRSLL
jgi:hypothetical protein